MPDQLKITLIQSNLHWENSDANLKMFDRKINSIKTNPDLIILPEMFTTGFSMNVKLAETMNGKAMQWLAEKAKQKNCVVTGSLMLKDGKNFFNRLIWMKPDGKFETYNKRHLFTFGNEHKFFTAGKKRLIVELNGWKICPLICYDLRFPVWCRNTPHSASPQPSPKEREKERDGSYDVLLFVTSWPNKRSNAWTALLKARAIENQSFVIGVNRVGTDGKEIFHSGDSTVIDFFGKVLFKRANKEIIHTTTLEKKPLEEFRKSFPALMDGDEFEIK